MSNYRGKGRLSLISLFVVSTMLFSIVGCGSSTSETGGGGTTPVTTQTVTLKGTVSALSTDLSTAGLSSAKGVTTYGTVRLMDTTTVAKGTVKVYSVDNEGEYTPVTGATGKVAANGTYSVYVPAELSNCVVRYTIDSASDPSKQIVLDAFQKVDAADVTAATAGQDVELDTPITPTTSILAPMIVDKVIKAVKTAATASKIEISDATLEIITTVLTTVITDLVNSGAISLSGVVDKPAASADTPAAVATYTAAIDKVSEDSTIQQTLKAEVNQKTDFTQLTDAQAKDKIYEIMAVIDKDMVRKVQAEGDFMVDLMALWVKEGTNTTVGTFLTNLRASKSDYIGSSASTVTLPTVAAILADLNTLLGEVKIDNKKHRAFFSAAGIDFIKATTTMTESTSIKPLFALYIMGRQIQVLAKTYGLENAMMSFNPVALLKAHGISKTGILWSDLRLENVWHNNVDIKTLTGMIGLSLGSGTTVSSAVVKNSAGDTVATMTANPYAPAGETNYMLNPWSSVSAPPAITSGTFTILVTLSDNTTLSVQKELVDLNLTAPVVSIVDNNVDYTLSDSYITQTTVKYLKIKWSATVPSGYETMFFLQVEKMDATTMQPRGMVYDNFEDANTALENQIRLEADTLYSVRVMGDLFKLGATTTSARKRGDASGPPKGFYPIGGGLVKVLAGSGAPDARTVNLSEDLYKQEFEDVWKDTKNEIVKMGGSNMAGNQYADDFIFQAAKDKGWKPEDLKHKSPQDFAEIINTFNVAEGGTKTSWDETAFDSAKEKRENMVEHWEDLEFSGPATGIFGTDVVKDFNNFEKYQKGVTGAVEIDYTKLATEVIRQQEQNRQIGDMIAKEGGTTIDYDSVDSIRQHDLERERVVDYAEERRIDTIDVNNIKNIYDEKLSYDAFFKERHGETGPIQYDNQYLGEFDRNYTTGMLPSVIGEIERGIGRDLQAEEKTTLFNRYGSNPPSPEVSAIINDFKTYSISGIVNRTGGGDTTGAIIVRTYTDPGFTAFDSETTARADGSYVITNVANRSYHYLKAFLDRNANLTPDNDEHADAMADAVVINNANATGKNLTIYVPSYVEQPEPGGVAPDILRRIESSLNRKLTYTEIQWLNQEATHHTGEELFERAIAQFTAQSEQRAALHDISGRTSGGSWGEYKVALFDSSNIHGTMLRPWMPTNYDGSFTFFDVGAGTYWVIGYREENNNAAYDEGVDPVGSIGPMIMAQNDITNQNIILSTILHRYSASVQINGGIRGNFYYALYNNAAYAEPAVVPWTNAMEGNFTLLDRESGLYYLKAYRDENLSGSFDPAMDSVGTLPLDIKTSNLSGVVIQVIPQYQAYQAELITITLPMTDGLEIQRGEFSWTGGAGPYAVEIKDSLGNLKKSKSGQTEKTAYLWQLTGSALDANTLYTLTVTDAQNHSAQRTFKHKGGAAATTTTF